MHLVTNKINDNWNRLKQKGIKQFRTKNRPLLVTKNYKNIDWSLAQTYIIKSRQTGLSKLIREEVQQKQLERLAGALENINTWGLKMKR